MLTTYYPQQAEQIKDRARELAFELGLGWPEKELVSAFIAQEPELWQAFENGRAYTAMVHQAALSAPAWLGEWRMEDNGQTERRPLVMQEEDGIFYPGEETSWCGGEGPTSITGEGYRDLDAAIRAAENE